MSAAVRGRRVGVTRPAHAVDGMADLLRARGLEPILLPLTRVDLDADPALRDALSRIAEYDWIVFTSANAVRSVRHALERSPTTPVGRVVAVGPSTAAVIEADLGWRVSVVPGEYRGGAVTEAMQAVADVAGSRVLWPRGEAAREELPRDLTAAGALLADPVAYRTVANEGVADRARRMAAADLDVLTFTAPSAIRAFAAGELPALRARIAVIGPSTAAAALDAGLPVHIQPVEHTIPALVDEVVRALDDDTETEK